MKSEFKNLAAVFGIFADEYDLDRQQNIGSLDLAIKQGHIDKVRLKEEIDEAIANPDFNWVEFAAKHRLLVAASQYTNSEILNYLKYLIWEYLFPERSLNTDRIHNFVDDAVNILQRETKNKQWMAATDLYNMLQAKYQDLDFFYMYHLLPLSNYKLERRFIPGNDIAVGYLRYK